VAEALKIQVADTCWAKVQGLQANLEMRAVEAAKQAAKQAAKNKYTDIFDRCDESTYSCRKVNQVWL